MTAPKQIKHLLVLVLLSFLPAFAGRGQTILPSTPPPAQSPAASPAAQTPAPAVANDAAAPPSFDVASIRANTTSSDGHHHIYNDPAESHFRAVNLSIKDLIQFAYGLPDSQILGGPAWLDSAMYDIDAKSDASADAQLHALPASEARRQKQLMVQALLAERFQLKTHQETRQLPLFNLVLARDGPKFKADNSLGNTVDTGRNHLHISGTQDTVATLARELAQVLGRVVIDDTGLAGSYDLRLRWTPDNDPPPMLNGQPDPNPPPDIFTALQEQLGLKLESAKGPVPVLVIDHIERPSGN
jgi:uncharacterized protein (TIGR03435 family)